MDEAIATVSGTDIVNYWNWMDLTSYCFTQGLDIKLLSMNGPSALLPNYTGMGGVEIKVISRKFAASNSLSLYELLISFIEALKEEEVKKGILSILSISKFKTKELDTNVAINGAVDQWDSIPPSETSYGYLIRYNFTGTL